MLSKFIEDCNRLLRSGRFSEMHGALCTQHVSLNNACTRTVCKWFWRDNGHLTLQIWTPADITSGEHAQSFFESFSRSQCSFWSKKSHWRKHGKIFRKIKLSRV